MARKVIYRDFDQFFQEKQERAVILRFHGQEHHLPASLPAPVLLMVERLRGMDANAALDEGVIVKLFLALFGQHRYTQWLNPPPGSGYKPLDIEQMIDLIGWAMQAYGEAPPDVEAPVDPQTPAQA